MPAFDALVIGAGIVGASVAARLAEAGLKVGILEAASAPATGATARSAAGVRVQFSEPANARLSWESIAFYREWPEADYRPIGYLFLLPEDRWPAWRRAMSELAAKGFPVELMTAEEALEIVPFDPNGIAGASFGPVDGVIDPHRATLGFLREARARGAELFLETPLERANREGETWRVETPKGAFFAPVVVNAAGAWAGEVARRAGLVLPVAPVRRSVYLTAPFGPPGWPLVVDMGSGVYFRPEGPRLLFGASNPQEPPGFREGVDWQWFIEVLLKAAERFPWFNELGLDKKAAWWGYYAETPDQNPILGEMPGAPGWFNAAGFSGHGVQQAPAVGRYLAEEVLGIRAQALEPFRYERFLRGTSLSEAGVV